MMDYTNLCVHETLRMFPAVPVFGRKLENDLVVGNYTLPAGCTVFIITPLLHRRSYANPYKFDPYNHLPDVVARRHPMAHLPFSAGPRNCIGKKTIQFDLVFNF
jgi:cytochrome P450